MHQNFRGQTENNTFERTRPPAGAPNARGANAPSQAPAVANHNPSYVLYLRPNCDACARAYEFVSKIGPNLVIENTDDMKKEGRPIPAFVRGVPTLLDIAQREAYPGPRCFKKLEDLSHTRVTQRQAIQEEGKELMPMDAFVGESTDDPVGIDGGGGDQYAPCGFQPTTAAQYPLGRQKTEESQDIISRIMGERDRPDNASLGANGLKELTPAQQSAIMNEMLEG